MDPSTTDPSKAGFSEGTVRMLASCASCGERHEVIGSSSSRGLPCEALNISVENAGTQMMHGGQKLPELHKKFPEVSVGPVDVENGTRTSASAATFQSLALSPESLEQTKLVSSILPTEKSGSAQNEETPKVQDFLKSATPVNDQEPLQVAEIRATLIQTVASKPAKIIETFRDIGLDKPADFKRDDVWAAMFRPISIGEGKKTSSHYQCYVCGAKKVYKRLDRARDHWRTHAGYKPIVCNLECGSTECKERFISMEAMKAHKYRAKYERKDCPYCNLNFEGRNFPKHAKKCPQKPVHSDCPDTPKKRRKITKDVSKDISTEAAQDGAEINPSD